MVNKINKILNNEPIDNPNIITKKVGNALSIVDTKVKKVCWVDNFYDNEHKPNEVLVFDYSWLQDDYNISDRPFWRASGIINI